MGKFRDIASIVVICLLAVVLLASSAQAKPASVLLQEGLYAEEIEGDLDAAIEIYEQIAADKSADSRYAAQAMYRLGLCYQKKQDYQMAKATFEKLIARFPKEKSIIEKVQPLLDQMSVQDPAALMPAETLVYLEFGSPGKQIETILNMLKGTQFANPLAVISGPRGPSGGRSPKDMMAALLNPSMMVEFKKIRGVALGFQAIHSNNPPLVGVIYPGESDALRGILLAALGMVLQAGEPVAGMQTLRMQDIGGAAYDDNVIILASPIDRLIWCAKQYKGVTNEPTLASQNKAFQKLGRKVREQNAVTIWANVDRIFPMLKEEMPDDQRRLIESIGDIGNVDEFTACLSLEKDGIAVETNIGFKDGHNCLAYNLIRTPNISKAGFEAVPPQAVGLVSFALSESEGGGVAGARKALKKLTGLDIGRELFANIEQVTLFGLPPTPTSNKHILAKSISPIVPCLGLAVTSHNPERTEQLVTQLLTLTDLVMGISQGEELADQRFPAVGEYKIGEFNGKPAYCYVGQAGKSTVLTLSPEVLQASLSAVKSKTSASSAGPLREVLSQLLPGTSKLVAVNAAGAIQFANVHICESHGVSPDPQKNYFSQLLGQLAQACDETYAVVRTDEKANNFGLNVNISGLPDFRQVFPLVAQIPEAMENPMLAASRPRPADKAMVKPAAAVELNWTPGRDVTVHKIYFGSNIDKLSLLDEVQAPHYDKLPAPERGITYYWRVDEVRADGSIVTGDIWSFSTGKLVAWWKFDEKSGKTVADSSGNNHHGTMVHGNPIWKADGKFGGCLDFNERYGISIPKEVFSSIDKAITISVWVYGNQRQKKHSDVILQAGAGDAGKPYIVSIYTDWLDYGLKFATGIGEPDRLEFNPGAPEDWTGRWNHYAFVKDADKGFQRIYMNGSLVAEKTGAMASMARVGAARIGIAPDRFGDQHIGRLDDFRIYNYALSGEEIQQLCGIVPGLGPPVEPVVEPAPPPTPGYLKGLVGHWKFDEGKGLIARDSARNYDGTLKGAKWTTGRLGRALEFDGDDGVYLEGSVGTDSLLDRGTRNLTISSWVKIRGKGGTIVARATRGSTSYRLGVTDNRAYIDIDHKQHWVLRTAPILQPDTWHHIVGVFDRSQKRARLYVDGIERTTGALTKSSCRISESTKIGCKSSTRDDTFKGAIDEVMIFNRALSAEEIRQLYTEVSGFRPEAEVELSDIDESPQAALIDFDTGKVVKIPDHLRKAGGDEAFPWVATRGLDVGAEFAGDEYGLFGIDVVATRIASEQWDKITPADLREALAAEPIGIQKDERATVMPAAKGEYPPTFAFRTREGGAGVLQIVDADRSKKTIHLRYKMLQEKIRPEVEVAPRQVFLPDADTPGVNVILDLASGELLPAGEGVQQLTAFREMGKGDLAYDRVLICLRGGKAKLLQAGKLTNLKIKGQIEDSTAYELLGLPCSLVITTAEGDNYEVTVMSADDKGASISYKKMLAEPALKDVQANPTEAMQRIGNLHNLVTSVGDAVKSGDCGTALPLLTELLRMAEEWKASIKGIQTAEACVDAAIAKLAGVRQALEKDDGDRARVAFEELEGSAPTLWTTFQGAMRTAIRKQWQMETETGSGFGQARVRLILSATKHHDNFVDLDTGQSLSGTGFGTRSGVYAWARTHKADVVYNGPISGLDGIDMAAVAIANENWYAMTPDSIRKQLASGVPTTPAAMGTGGMEPATYVFKTREGGLGILQLINFHQQAMFRYKMVQDASRADGLARREKSRNMLHQLAVALWVYADEHDLKMPAGLNELRPYIKSDAVFRWAVDNVQYINQGTRTPDTDVPTAYDKTMIQTGEGTNVLFIDAHVEFLTPEELENRGILGGKAPTITIKSR